jgi:hypothetical protein
LLIEIVEPTSVGSPASGNDALSFKQPSQEAESANPTWSDVEDSVSRTVSETGEDLKVFVVGIARSGTSILLQAIQEVFALPGHGESHVMPAIQRAVYEVRKYWRGLKDSEEDILIKQFPVTKYEQTVFDMIKEFYKETYGGSWVDKTPTDEAMHGISLIKRIFPQARIIVTRRSGIEVIESFRKKFGSTINDACDNWTRAMQGLVYARNENVDFIEVDQFEFTNHSDDVAKRISLHLGRPDKINQLAAFLHERRVEQSSSHDWKRRLTLDEVQWSDDEKKIFIDSCGPVMRQLGYPIFSRDREMEPQ